MTAQQIRLAVNIRQADFTAQASCVMINSCYQQANTKCNLGTVCHDQGTIKAGRPACFENIVMVIVKSEKEFAVCSESWQASLLNCLATC